MQVRGDALYARRSPESRRRRRGLTVADERTDQRGSGAPGRVFLHAIRPAEVSSEARLATLKPKKTNTPARAPVCTVLFPHMAGGLCPLFIHWFFYLASSSAGTCRG